MALKSGDKVIDKETGWVGTIVKQRLDEDVYKVSFERYIGGSNLQSMSEAEAEYKASKPVEWYAPERTKEIVKLTHLLKQDLQVGILSDTTIESMENLKLLRKI